MKIFLSTWKYSSRGNLMVAWFLPLYKILPNFVSIKDISSPRAAVYRLSASWLPCRCAPPWDRGSWHRLGDSRLLVRSSGGCHSGLRKLRCSVYPWYGQSDGLLLGCNFSVITGDLSLKETRRWFSMHNHKLLFLPENIFMSWFIFFKYNKPFSLE